VDNATLSLVILGVVVALFVWNRLPVEIIAVGTALVLYFTGLLDLRQALAGFGDPVVIFIASLFVVSKGIDSTGVTTWAGQWLIARAGPRPRRLLVLTMLLCAVLTALISLNGAVAALLPMVVVLAIRTGVPPSRLAMPLAFAGSAGSLLALTGTPINVIVSETAVDAGERSFGFFEFAIVGVPLVAGTIAIAVFLGPRVLPDRTAKAAPSDLSRYASTIVQHYALEHDLYRLRVRERSPFVGVAPDALDLAEYPGLTLVAVQSGRANGPAAAQAAVATDDVIVVRGDADSVSRIVADKCLAAGLAPVAGGDGGRLLGRELGVAEVVVPPRSVLIGQTVFPGMVRDDDKVILAVHRLGRDRGPAQTVLAEGDTLLIQGSWDALDRTTADPDVLVVDSPDLVRAQAAPIGPQGYKAVAVLAGMVILLAAGVMQPAVAGLLAAGAMVMLGVVRLEQAYRAISWTTVILVAGLIPLSVAMENSGAADKIAHLLITVVGNHGPYALMIGLFLLTGVLGQVISNTATALVMIPIALSAAAEIGVSPRPILMLMTVAAAASFLTPIATPANMMVMGPGGYRFGDYWKLGLPIMCWFLIVSLTVIPVVWPF
jgi:di/tricarboxylate transporter